jgi:hypothetical protein
MRKKSIPLFVAGLFMLFADTHGQEITLSSQDREIIVAAVNIGMTEEQRPRFRQAVATFIEDYRSSILKISRRNNATNLERTIDKERRLLIKKLDLQVSDFLSPAQMARYDVFRGLMLSKHTQSNVTGSGEVEEPDIRITSHH